MSDDEIDLESLSDEDLVAQMHHDLNDRLPHEIVRGTQILLAPGDYLRATKATVGAIAKEKG